MMEELLVRFIFKERCHSIRGTTRIFYVPIINSIRVDPGQANF
jgi:hypothetical protein